MSSATFQILSTLSSTAAEIEAQSKISSSLSDAIADIELAHSINQDLNHHLLLEKLNQEKELAEKALAEYKALENYEQNERKIFAEKLLLEMMRLERHLIHLEDRQKQDAATIELNVQETSQENVNFDDSQQENLEQLNQQEEEEEEEEEEKEEILVESFARNDMQDVQIEEEEEDRGSYQPPTIPTQDGPDAAAGVEHVDTTPVVPTLIEEETPVEPQRQVQLAKIKKVRPPPSLDTLHSTNLMVVFEYLDAIDILNMAQTSVKLYSKVDGLFGLGGTIVAGSRSLDEDEYESEEELPAVILEDEDNDDDELNNVVPMKPSSSDKSLDSQQPTIVSIPASKPRSRTNSEASMREPTKVKLPPKKSSSALSSSAHNNTAAAATSLAISSTNNTASATTTTNTATTTAAASSKKTTTTPSAPSSSSASSGGYQMSAAVAQSLASKLLPAELSAIITMRDQLRQKEEEALNAKNELQDLTAQLEGIMSVKEVLTQKVQELQQTLVAERDASLKITQQTASDQEVIAFLDERVQDLEKCVDNFQYEKSKTNKVVEKIKDASERQVAVLNDMLTYEREQRSDQEKEWKSTKKVLVKEVKHCRAQIMTLEAERDGFREENQRLKEALLSLGVGSKQGKSFD